MRHHLRTGGTGEDRGARVVCALGCRAAAAGAALLSDVRAFQASLASLWSVPCDNRVKETLWRLAVAAIPGCRVRQWRCPCCTATHAAEGVDQRRHCFWQCPVAAAVVAQLDAALRAAGGGAAVTRAALWLLQPPQGARVTPAVWRLVCAAALDAMEYERRLVWARSLEAAWEEPDRRRVAGEAGRLTAARFWQHLQDFCLTAPEAGDWALPADHPFIGVVEGRLRVALPAAPRPAELAA